jgi:8-oxo-dGTP diphosphatase
MGMPLLVVRHADAGHRSQYQGDDRERPLSAQGRAQAAALVDLLSGYRPEDVLSSPFVRCVETVQPLADALALRVGTTDELAEGHEAEALRLMNRQSGKTVVLCTHGDVALAILEALGGRGDPAGERRLQKGEVWVIEPQDSTLAITDHIGQPAVGSEASPPNPPPVR